LKTPKTKIIFFISYLFSIFAAGAVLPLAFAPYNFWPLAILSPAYLLWAWMDPKLNTYFLFDPQYCHSKSSTSKYCTSKYFIARYFNFFHSQSKQAFLIGFIYGLGMFGVGVSWVFVSIHRFGNTEAPLAAFLTAVMVSLLALLTGFQGYILKRFFKGSNTTLCLLGFPCLWVLFEWFRSIYFTGFPWLFLGYTQLNTPLAGFAPIASVYAVSLAVAMSSGALILLLLNFSTRSQLTRTLHNPKSMQESLALERRNLCNPSLETKNTQYPRKILTLLSLVVLAGLWGGGEFLRQHPWTETQGRDYTVSLVQGNISPVDKFAQVDPIQAARNTYVALSTDHWTSDLIIWPENAIAYPLPMVQPFLNELKNMAQMNKATLITGLQTIMHNRDYHNSMIALGEGSGIYHKRHLVPFGDYLPLEGSLRGLINFFDIPMSSFVAGPQVQTLLKAGDLNIAPLICYEIAFPGLVRETTQNANVIVTVSEDGWFGDSFGPHQHLEIARMRALETGRPLLRATTSGISAIINNKGEFLTVSPQFQALVLKGTFKTVKGETPWMKFGLIPLFVFLVIGFYFPGRFFHSSIQGNKKKVL